jgi:penicillin amidase
MDRDRPEPLIFEAWLREFNRAVYADELGDSFPFYWAHRPLFINFVLEEGAAWCDDLTKKAQQSCPEVLAQSLRAALQMLEDEVGPPQDWRWGAVHDAQFIHDFFNPFPIASRFASRSIPADGGAYTLNRIANFLGSMDQPFAGRHGAGYRAVYDLSDLSASRFMTVPGQSGNPMSEFYDNLLGTWREGGWIQMKAERDSLRRRADARLLLLPRGRPH